MASFLAPSREGPRISLGALPGWMVIWPTQLTVRVKVCVAEPTESLAVMVRV